MPASKPSRQHVRVACYVPPETYQALRHRAAVERLSGEELIRRALAAYLGIERESDDGGAK